MTVILFIIYISILLFSVVLHEVSHGAVANRLGDPTARLMGRLTLNPLPHIDLVGSIIVPGALVLFNMLVGGGIVFGWAKPVPYNPLNFKGNKKRGELLVALAGPAVNLILAVIFGLALRFMPLELLNDPQFTGVFLVFLIIVFINLLLGLFNLVPIPPLDGSKLLYTLFSISSQTRIFLERNGFLLLLLFIFFGLQLFFPLVTAVFTWLTGIPLETLLNI
jgi:Zn-dependent protease